MAQVLRPETIGTITKLSNTQLTIGPSYAILGGQQRPTSTITINTATSGINGIDTGTIAINQFYYVYIVRNNATGVTGGVISLNSSTPTGFTSYKQVGQCTTDGSSLLVAANKKLEDNEPVGHVISAMLTEAQFRAVHGPGWILADGRTTVGSKYAAITGNASAPDLRGVVLRGKNNGIASTTGNPSGEVNLGVYQTDAFQGHLHTFGEYAFAGDDNGPHWEGTNLVRNTNTSAPVNDGTNGTPRTSTETRMRNVTVNHFIKVN